MPAAPSHGLDSLAERAFNHAAHRHQRADQGRQDQDHLRRRRHRPGDRIRRRGRRHRAAAVAGAQAAAGRRARAHGLRDAGAAAACGARPHGAARHFDRPAGAVAAVRRVRARGGAASKPRSTQLAGETVNAGSPKQLGDILFGKLRTAGRHQDQDRPMGDRRARCSRNWPSRATSCRRRSSTGGRCRN